MEQKNKVLETKNVKKSINQSFTYITNLSWVIEEKVLSKTLPKDLTLGELHVIESVSKNNNKPISVIAKDLKVTIGSLMTCLKRLVLKEYLVRTRDDVDKRIVRMTVTTKAKKALKIHDAYHEKIINQFVDKLQRKEVNKILDKLVETLENELNPVTEESK